MKSFKQYNEALGVKKYYGTKSLPEFFKSLGWVMLGDGHFATVWKPQGKDYVIKAWVGTDRAYERFLSFCIKNRGNKHVPKVIGRLKSIPAFYIRSTRQEKVKLVKLEILENIDYEEYQKFLDVLNNYDRKYVNKNDPDIVSLHNTLVEMEKWRIGWEDFHSGNVMQRENMNGSVDIVIVDPWAHEEDIDDVTVVREKDRNRYLPKYDKPHYLEKDKGDKEVDYVEGDEKLVDDGYYDGEVNNGYM
jgi:hypothetical protein